MATATTKKQAPEVTVPEFAAVVAEGEPIVTRAIQDAADLLRQQRDIQQRIGKNREMLRLFDGNELLTETQGEWLDAFYPQKEKGSRRSDEEIAKTRKVRAAALGVNESEVADESADE